MVVIRFPATLDTDVTHDRVASPSTCTVHMPQTDMPHPYLVPLRLRMSRIIHRSGMSAGASTVVDLPFTVSLKGMASDSTKARGSWRLMVPHPRIGRPGHEVVQFQSP